MIYYIVEFHADGGQMCVLGIRCFIDKQKADEFAQRMCSEKNHYCGPSSVKQRESETQVENEGEIYPTIANIGRTFFHP